jgi:chemotaxis protein histidine kinase CheA
MSGLDDTVAQQIAALRQAYLAQLPAKLAEIVTAIDDWRSRGDPDVLFNAYRLTHSLAGSGAIYGIAELSEAARAMELFVKPFAECKCEATADDLNTLSGHIESLRGVIARATAAVE